MSNEKKALPSVEVEFGDGTKATAVCSFGAMIRFQTMTGRNPFDSEQMEKLSPKDMVQLVAACVYPQNPEEKLLEIAEKMSGKNIKTVTNIIVNLFKMADEDKGEEEEGEGDKKKEVKKVQTEKKIEE